MLIPETRLKLVSFQFQNCFMLSFKSVKLFHASFRGVSRLKLINKMNYNKMKLETRYFSLPPTPPSKGARLKSLLLGSKERARF